MAELFPIEQVPPMRRDMDVAANRLPSTRALSGASLTLRLDRGSLSLVFSEEELRWELGGTDGSNWSGQSVYDAVEVRPGVFFVVFSAADGSGALSIVIDRVMGRALVVQDRFTQRDGETVLRVDVDPARLDGHPGAYVPMAETRELLGKRLYSEYSTEAALEHVYLNSGTLAWQWVRVDVPELKREVGVVAASYWEVRTQLHLLATCGAVGELTLLLDLDQKRSIGRTFGKSRMGNLLDQRCGANLVFLGEFSYPGDRQPG